MEDLDRILNPYERFLEYQDYLIDLIAGSYHKSFKDIIATRIKNAFYYFDSPPDISYQIVKRFNPNIRNLIKYFLLSSYYKLARYELKAVGKRYYCNHLKEALSINDSFLIKIKI